MRNLICLFAISLFILTACKDKKNSGADDRVTVISVDLKKSEHVAMKDIISRIEIVELENKLESYFAYPRHFQVAGGKYYLDSSSEETVLAFDADGKFLYNTASRRGNGRNEYLYLSSIHADKEGNLSICSSSGYVKYDPSLKAVDFDKTSLSSFPRFISDDIIAYVMKTTDDSLTMGFYSTALHKAVGRSSVPIQIRETPMFAIRRTHTPVANDKEVLYMRNLMGDFNIYRLDPKEKTITAAYRYEADNMLKESYQDEFMEYMGGQKNDELNRILADHTSLWDLFINNNFMLAILGGINLLDQNITNNLHISFYSPKDGKQRLIDTGMKGGKELYLIDWMDDEIIYTLMEARQMKDIDKMIDMDLLDDHSKEILGRLNDDSNAYVIKYYLRDDIL